MLSFFQSLFSAKEAVYSIKDITSPAACALDAITLVDKVISYPTSKALVESPDTVSSSLAIVHGDSLPANATGKWIMPFGAPVYESSIMIVLKQQTQNKRESLFVLAECHLMEKANEVLQTLDLTLKPLLKAGTIFFTKALLEALIIPSPCPAENLSRHLIELMEHKPEIFSYWYKVAGALDPLQVENESDKLFPKFDNNTKEGNTLNKDLQHVDNILLPASHPLVNEEVLFTPGNNKLSLDLTLATSIEEENEEFFTPTAKPDNQFSFEVTSPLITSVSLGYSKSSLFFLLGGSDPNCYLPESGDTPLHIAAQQGNTLLVKLLIAFEADPRKVNYKGETPSQKALDSGTHDCVVILDKVVSLLEDMDNLPKKRTQTGPKGSQSLLCLDGGGARAIMEIQVLIAIEKQLKELDPQSSSILDYFDYIAGTSGGAYIMFITVYGKTSLKGSRAMVFSALNKIASSTDSRERVEILEDFLKEVLGEDGVMSDVQTPRVMAMSTLADVSPCKLHLVTNYGEERDGQLGPSKRKQWEAARMTSAIPVYFGSFQNKFLDGGVMANNPTLDAITEIHAQNRKEGTNEKLGTVLSLGSGISERKSISDIDCHLPRASLSSLLELPRSLKGLKNLGEIVLCQLAQTDGQEVDRCRAWCDQMGADYYRVSPSINEKIPLDETDINKMILTMFDAQMHVLREAETINNIALDLVSK